MLFALSVLWGGSLYFNELVIEESDPFTTTFGRVAIAGAVLWLFLHARGIALPASLADWRDLLIIAGVAVLIGPDPTGLSQT